MLETRPSFARGTTDLRDLEEPQPRGRPQEGQACVDTLGQSCQMAQPGLQRVLDVPQLQDRGGVI